MKASRHTFSAFKTHQPLHARAPLVTLEGSEIRSRRNVRPAVIFLLDRTEFGSELTKWNLLSEPECRTLLEVEPKPCIWEFTANQVRGA
ncbi:hypothetical protein LR48_Vigan01g313800 [Vigna angularis]|uniref:Uncharacterized protein n=1 Tax=Phaseolus angularis TaxID=3914 RepID=A0A0L9TT52_PHAAN|nr:hypothetical protein LR48_Vigan01g313800 [Vigna angularis]